ncbi:uncharacterized protein LOC126366415 [Pectinophora gossypiella]|uniref:uncharacterized protein LOC126366415 n=1 Tax=Pectinophora gossypiella TaxID=13191 RepID=UPI00214F2602|nr:uncharacterized protein LOC126366415 [Pectinophora gossypiella]
MHQTIGSISYYYSLFSMILAMSGMVLFNASPIITNYKNGAFTSQGSENIRLIACIDHHREIFKFTEELSSFFGPVLGFNYAYHMCACCLLMMECSQGDVDAIIRFGPLTIIVFGQLVQMSVIFEIVDTVSEKLKDSVYDVPWESMDTRNCRLVIILLNRVQSPLHVTAMGITPVGVTTMAGILFT